MTKQLPESLRRTLPPGPRSCSTCFYEYGLLRDSPSGPTCVNQTNCRKRQSEVRKQIRMFISRLDSMPPLRRGLWVAALKEAIWRVPAKSGGKVNKKDVDSDATFEDNIRKARE